MIIGKDEQYIGPFRSRLGKQLLPEGKAADPEGRRGPDRLEGVTAGQPAGKTVFVIIVLIVLLPVYCKK